MKTNGHQYKHKTNKPTQSVLERQRAVLFNDYSGEWSATYWRRIGQEQPTSKVVMYANLVKKSKKVIEKKALKNGRAKKKRNQKKAAAALAAAPT